ncbi:type II toxin-antitoxin system RelE/ParE family toxin [Huaxiibacter chinensis]|uniref:type II toxin-antitoxin system RelE/ParE family toxin n=1 Tax=Huaxiibacter chinensis TaxID=2899785 RepID=UPI003F9DE7D4
MLFIETEIFTQDVKLLLDDVEYHEFQVFLATQPDYGDVIPNTGGLRKIRWLAGGKGKRGGVRVIYYHRIHNSEIRLLLIYRKGIKDDLSASEKAVLKKLNEGW